MWLDLQFKQDRGDINTIGLYQILDETLIYKHKAQTKPLTWYLFSVVDYIVAAVDDYGVYCLMIVSLVFFMLLLVFLAICIFIN